MLDLKRRTYITPEIREFELDRDILLVMASPNDGSGPTDPGGGGGPPQPTASQASTFEENPFTETNLQ